MSEVQVQKLVQVAAQFGVQLKVAGTRIIKINHQDAELDAATYMPDQMIELIMKIVGVQMQAAYIRA
ncbi:hypothetical protein [Levilactobacillus bambusae]|uniref:Uncharacterized protein n=1 Tax=Levilactobacillus bambusae TaxID=2024736 RepID=A0A2V1MZ53_9LACO|nr:hypothetical protein [Levilactobacillus bambusae]PWG00092.1 hypothetical protein DCM90_03925 [Levilactobacillus bambusae]